MILEMKTIYFILCLCSVGLSAQTLEEKVADELCACLKDSNVNTDEQLEKAIEGCMLNSMQTHLKDIYLLSDTQSNEFWDAVMGLMTTKCLGSLALKLGGIEKTEPKPTISVCEDIKIGNYYYEIEEGRRHYLAFTPHQVLENRADGIYTNSNIEWLDKCVYKLTLQDTNSRFDEIHMKNNPYTFNIVENTPDYFIVQTQYVEAIGVQNVKIHKLPYHIKDNTNKKPASE